MSVILRPYQLTDKARIYEAWQSHRSVLFRADTGYGKTLVLSSIIEEHNGGSAIIAHRHELVSQISLMLAKNGVQHNIIASVANARAISELHVEETGRNYFDPGSRCGVASVDTLVRRDNLSHWFPQVTKIIVDEGHHVVVDNKWHKALDNFTNPNVKILLPTATPKRADGKGLGIDSDGIADVMIEGPPMQWLIDEGYLTDYKLATVDSHIEQLLGKISESGDWSNAQLRTASQSSPIVGDVVENYQALAAGKLAIVFASDVKTATEMLENYRRAGVKAELLTGETDPKVRRHILKALANRQVHVLVAVDIISEGFDLPAVEVAVLSRATASLAVFLQQCGRALRPVYAPGFDLATRTGRLAAIAASNKPHALFIDHVGNFMRHMPPDTPRVWTLDRAGKRSSGPSETIPMRICTNTDPACGKAYLRVLSCCPRCGKEAPLPAGRSSPEMVDGAISLLDDDVLAALRGRVDAMDLDIQAYRAELAATGLPSKFIVRNLKSRMTQQDAQGALRLVMGQWGGDRRAAGMPDNDMQRLFYFRFGIDVLSAQALATDDAYALLTKIAVDL